MTTKQNVELTVAKIWTVCKSLPTLPFELADASVKYEKAEGKTEEADDARRGGVGQDLRLDYRWIDLRVTAHNAIMRISSGVCTLFREFLLRFVPRLAAPRWSPAAAELVSLATATASRRCRRRSCRLAPAREGRMCSRWTTSAPRRALRSRRSCTSKWWQRAPTLSACSRLAPCSARRTPTLAVCVPRHAPWFRAFSC